MKRNQAQAVAKRKLSETQTRLEDGLNVLDSDEADQIIGEPGQGYKELIQAVQANTEMLYSLAITHGLRKNKATADVFSKSTMLMLALVHKAYALGKKHGQA